MSQSRRSLPVELQREEAGGTLLKWTGPIAVVGVSPGTSVLYA